MLLSHIGKVIILIFYLEGHIVTGNSFDHQAGSNNSVIFFNRSIMYPFQFSYRNLMCSSKLQHDGFGGGDGVRFGGREA
ncbi:unnamed protein product [Urochloa humidicola]